MAPADVTLPTSLDDSPAQNSMKATFRNVSVTIKTMTLSYSSYIEMCSCRKFPTVQVLSLVISGGSPNERLPSSFPQVYALRVKLSLPCISILCSTLKAKAM